MTPWTPLGAGPDMYEVLHEEVPSWMDAPLWEWVAYAEAVLAGNDRNRAGEFAIEYDRVTQNREPFLRRAGAVTQSRLSCERKMTLALACAVLTLGFSVER